MTEKTSTSANPIPTHPALTVTNIFAIIKDPLDRKNSQYTTWAELFKNHAKAYLVLDYIIPSTDDASEFSFSTMKTKNPSLWNRIDAIVLQWIYGSITLDLLNTIIGPNLTAAKAWTLLEELFADNKDSRALYLQQEFSNVRMENFSDASSYCQHLKTLFDQLANVGAPVENDRLVLQLISSLTDAYESVASQIRHGDILPQFNKARSMIVLEESACSKKIVTTAESAAVSVSKDQSEISQPLFPPAGASQPTYSRGGDNFSCGGGGGSHNHRGGGNGSKRGRQGRGGGRWSPRPFFQQGYGPWGFGAPWASAPCPYPTFPNYGHARAPFVPPAQPNQQGLLGAQPTQHAHLAQECFPTKHCRGYAHIGYQSAT